MANTDKCFEDKKYAEQQGNVNRNCCCLVTKSCLTLCNPMDCSMAVLPVLHHLQEFAQVHVHWIGDAIQPSHPLSPSSPAFNLSQHRGLFQWVSSSHQAARVLEIQLQLQHQSFQWVFRVDFFLGLTGLISLQSKGLSRVFSNTTVRNYWSSGLRSRFFFF